MDNQDSNKEKKKFTWSKLFGYGLISFGVLSILDLFSPIPIPTVGLTAILSGGVFILLGAVLLNINKSFWLDLVRRNRKLFAKPQVQIDPLLPVKILKLSKAHNGILTSSQVAIELNIPLDMAEAGLDECLRFNHATADYDMKRELKYYKFQEHLPLDETSEGNKQLPGDNR